MARKNPNLKELLKKWQPRLGLHNWDIKVKYCKPADMEGCQGLNEFEQTYLTSSVKILKPEYYSDPNFPQDIEATLIHELLHLHFVFLRKSSDNAGDAEEQAIELLTRAVLYDRKKTTTAVGEGPKRKPKGASKGSKVENIGGNSTGPSG